ncbi:MAG: hypothetical protein QNL11_04050 [Desulfobacterales bacterium]|nr:hypothetical protein [Desulfobacterales bacterium]
MTDKKKGQAEFKPGATVGSMAAFTDGNEDAFQRSAIVALEALQLCVAFCVNQKDACNLQLMQAICGQMFKNASGVLKSGGQYKVGPT